MNEATETTEQRHGELDPDASAMFEAMLQAARDEGFATTPDRLMSNAIRAYFGIVTGQVMLTEPDGRPVDPYKDRGQGSRATIH